MCSTVCSTVQHSLEAAAGKRWHPQPPGAQLAMAAAWRSVVVALSTAASVGGEWAVLAARHRHQRFRQRLPSLELPTNSGPPPLPNCQTALGTATTATGRRAGVVRRPIAVATADRNGQWVKDATPQQVRWGSPSWPRCVCVRVDMGASNAAADLSMGRAEVAGPHGLSHCFCHRYHHRYRCQLGSG